MPRIAKSGIAPRQVKVTFTCDYFRPDEDNWCTTKCSMSKCPNNEARGKREKKLYAELAKLKRD